MIYVTAACAVIWASVRIAHWLHEYSVLREVVARLSADSRVAEVLVTKSEFDETTKKIRTTIKFLEYDAENHPLPPKYFTFQGNVIQFQSLVVRFDDKFVRAGDRLRGKSACLFMKAFMLDGKNTQTFEITKAGEIPGGYKVPDVESKFETEIWRDFWKYALEPDARQRMGIKNAQIEAPGSLFRPGTIYTLRLEHDGGIRIDTHPIPQVLKGEQL